MKLMSDTLFSFSERAKIQSQFTQRTNTNRTLQKNDLYPPSLSTAEDLYQKLIQAPIKLELLDIFVLMSWRSEVWKTPQGQRVMKHWWQSVFDSNMQRTIMMLRVALADYERWPGPIPVVKAMQQELQSLLKKGEWPNKNQIAILLAIIKQDALMLATLAFVAKQTVQLAMQTVNLPVNLPIVLTAEEHWLDCWFTLKPVNQKDFSKHFHQMLHENLPLERKIQFGKVILNTVHLPHGLDSLKNKVGHYPDIVTWLSNCIKKHEFKINFSNEEKKRLNCWVGTGNYEALKTLLTKIALGETEDINKTLNRYRFWNNYQHLFEETWFLLPPDLYARYPDVHRLRSVRVILGYSYPMALIKIRNYYFIQTFIGGGTDVDFLATENIENIEIMLSNLEMSYTRLSAQNWCLIHDHFFCWQADLAYILDKNFAITPTGAVINITEYMDKNYMLEVKREEFQKDRKEGIEIWLSKAKRRHSLQSLQFAALGAKKYGLI